MNCTIFALQEPDKPNDAMNYLKNIVGGTSEDKQVIGNLRTENSDLKAKVMMKWVKVDPIDKCYFS